MRKSIVGLALYLILAFGMVACGGSSSPGSRVTDTTAPSVPGGLIVTTISTNQINLSWSAATDNVGVSGYKVYRGGSYLKSSTTPTATDIGLTASKEFCYQISAFDPAGNESAKCSEVCATTLTSVIGTNQSITTACAEDDNINISFTGHATSFSIQATHPNYSIETDNCTADFTNCTSTGTTFSFTPATYNTYDDHETVVTAVRQALWWRPTGMTFSVDNGTQYSDIHYITVSQKVVDEDSWPQYLVLYMDGNMRLIPQPPIGINKVCFGSSVIIGPTLNDTRPLAEIVSAHYVSSSKTIEVTYKAGGTAILSIGEVNRTHARVGVSVNYSTDANPFAVLRSMYVMDGNADVDHVQWTDQTSSSHDDSIMNFINGESSDWLFHRVTRSSHNTSAPDITITTH
jgi:hypothetical protein